MAVLMGLFFDCGFNFTFNSLVAAALSASFFIPQAIAGADVVPAEKDITVTVIVLAGVMTLVFSLMGRVFKR